MTIIKGLEWTFDTVASTYEKFRPGYAAELYKTIFDYAPIGLTEKAVEVGIGGGQATLPFLQTGCSLTAVEYGEQFSQICQKKFSAFSKFHVITDKFENVDFETDTYNLVYSASAFHWIPEDIGYSKVFSRLKSDGVFARFANHPAPDKGRPNLTEEIQALYAAYYYKFHNKTPSRPAEFQASEAAARAEIAGKYGFTDITYSLFRRTRSFTAEEYITLLGTYSDHIVMEEGIRTEFFRKIAEAIEKHGGQITIYDTMDLQLARKP